MSPCITDSWPKPYRTSLGRNKVNVGRKTVQKLNELKAAIFQSRENIEEDVKKRLVFPGVVIAIHGGMARSTKTTTKPLCTELSSDSFGVEKFCDGV